MLFCFGGFDCSLLFVVVVVVVFLFVVVVVAFFVLRLCIMSVNLLRGGVESIKIMGFSESMDTILN